MAIPQSVKNLYHLSQAVFANLYFKFPSRGLTIIGVTGTDGKTTTSTLIYQILKTSGVKVALISTVAAYIGNEELDTGFHVTSPDPWSLQKLLVKIKKLGYRYVVLEATSHGLDQHRLFGIQPYMAVLTNITHEHLDYHKTYKRYVKAKSKLFKDVKIAVLNHEDKSFNLVKKYLDSKTRIIAYTEKSTPHRIRSLIRKKFPEHYNKLNATAASLACAQIGILEENILKGLKNFEGIPGRMEFIKNNKKIKAIVDFAHTPNALENALKTLSKSKTGRLIAVFGCAGLRDVSKRPMMGKIASELADEVVMTAEDPRTESVWSIIDQMMSNVKKNIGHIHKIPDRGEAIKFAVSIAKAGDTVAVFGKGHEKSMCYGTIEYPWSDQEALKKELSL